jgi:hypothetical protein
MLSSSVAFGSAGPGRFEAVGMSSGIWVLAGGGEATMKMISRHSRTSTIGVTLISHIAPPSSPPTLTAMVLDQYTRPGGDVQRRRPRVEVTSATRSWCCTDAVTGNSWSAGSPDLPDFSG